MSYVVTLGETMALMRSETPGPLAHASSLGLGIGGAESNFAIALTRLGTPSAWVGRVGADSFGELVARELRAEGVAVTAIADAEAPTGLMVKERRTQHATRVMYYRSGSAGSRLAPEDIDDDLVAGASLLHVTGITPALSQSAAQTVVHAIGVARRAGVTVSFDFNYRAALWPKSEAAIAYRTLVPLADIVFAGADEAAILVGEADDPHELAQRIEELGPSSAIIKLGPDGAVARIDGADWRQPAVPVDVVDSVGAGDAFVAGYLSELLRGEPVATRLATAATSGAFACLVPGDWEGMPRRSELGLLTATEPVAR